LVCAGYVISGWVSYLRGWGIDMSDASIQGVLKHWMKRGSTMPCAHVCDVLSGSNGIFEPARQRMPTICTFFIFLAKITREKSGYRQLVI